jgi:hypothetical protein
LISEILNRLNRTESNRFHQHLNFKPTIKKKNSKTKLQNPSALIRLPLSQISFKLPLSHHSPLIISLFFAQALHHHLTPNYYFLLFYTLHFIIITYKQKMKRLKTFFCINLCFFYLFLLKRDVHFFYVSQFHGFFRVVLSFYELVEILLVLLSFRLLFCTCTWLKSLPFRPINLSSIFSICWH